MNDLAEKYLNQGISKLSTGNYSGAIEDLDKAIDIEPSLALAYYHRAEAKSWLNKDFVDDYLRTIELAPEFLEVYDSLGVHYLSNGFPKEAEKIYKMALEVSPNFIDAYFGLAKVCLVNSDKKQAEVYATKAIQVKPSNFNTHLFRAWIRDLSNNCADALVDANNALQLDPENPEVLDWRARIKFELRDYIGAIHDLNKTIELSYKRSFAYFLRALCKCQLGKLQDGIDDLTKALELDEMGWFYYCRAIMYLQQEHYDLALSDCDKAIQLDGNFAECYPYRGAAKYALGDLVDAKKDWRESGMTVNQGKEFLQKLKGGFDFGTLY